MHEITNYEGLKPVAKQRKAMQDVIGYLGQPAVDAITKEAKATEMPFETFQNCMNMFAGISGYPVKAFYNYIFPL